jgi:acyl dehydratase
MSAAETGQPATADEPLLLGGPWFEEFEPEQVFDDAPGLTITDGHAALHQAICGDRLRLALDAALCQEVTGSDRPLVHPNLVCDVAIGQSTGPTQRVKGNLFYRGFVLNRPVFVGDTLRTRTQVVGLKQNKRKPGKPGTGLVVLKIHTENQDGEQVTDYWRCPMIPLKDDVDTGHADDFGDIPQEIPSDELKGAIPARWKLGPLREAAPGPHFADLEPGLACAIEGGETVTAAPELARLSLNVAMAHTDATSSGRGQRLVYGGHTISIAAAHATRAVPAMATIIAWRSCDHLGPVFEGDVLRTELRVEGLSPRDDGGLAELRALVSAVREGEDEPQAVLDWSFVALVA